MVIGFILGMLSWSRIVPPWVGWVGTGLFLVPLIGSLVASTVSTSFAAAQRRTRTNPLIAAAYVIAFILIGLSWHTVHPTLVILVGVGISLVATRHRSASGGKKNRRVMTKGAPTEAAARKPRCPGASTRPQGQQSRRAPAALSAFRAAAQACSWDRAANHLLAWPIAKPSPSEDNPGFSAITEAPLEDGAFSSPDHKRNPR